MPGQQGEEVAFHTTSEDQDSDMGDDMIYHSSHATEVVCGIYCGGRPWCRGARTTELSYDGNLTKFLDGEAGEPSCWAVAVARWGVPTGIAGVPPVT